MPCRAFLCFSDVCCLKLATVMTHDGYLMLFSLKRRNRLQSSWMTDILCVLATLICWLGRDSYHRNLLIPRWFVQKNMMCRSNANPMPFLHEPPEYNDSVEGTCKPFRSPKPRYGPRSLPMVPKAHWWHSRCRVRHLVWCKLSSHAASTSCLSPIYWVSMSCGEMRSQFNQFR